jgi:hypothetical protein
VGSLAGFDDVLADKAAIQALIPDGADVAADVYLVDQIVDRTHVQVAYSSWQDETGAEIHADYVFLDLDTISYNNRITPWVAPLINRLTGEGYRQVARAGRFVLLESSNV